MPTGRVVAGEAAVAVGCRPFYRPQICTMRVLAHMLGPSLLSGGPLLCWHTLRTQRGEIAGVVGAAGAAAAAATVALLLQWGG